MVESFLLTQPLVSQALCSTCWTTRKLQAQSIPLQWFLFGEEMLFSPRVQDWKREREMLRASARERKLSSLLSCMTLANQCQKLFPCQLTDQDVPVSPTAYVIYIYSYLAEDAMKWCLTVYGPPSWTVPRRGRKAMGKKSSITSQIQLTIRGKQGWCISQDHWLNSS